MNMVNIIQEGKEIKELCRVVADMDHNCARDLTGDPARDYNSRLAIAAGLLIKLSPEVMIKAMREAKYF